jgi:hypothetical protein
MSHDRGLLIFGSFAIFMICATIVAVAAITTNDKQSCVPSESDMRVGLVYEQKTVTRTRIQSTGKTSVVIPYTDTMFCPIAENAVADSK